MKDLGKWQMISFLSRGMAMALGLVQSFIIIRILSVSEWGIVQLAVSIGGALGIYQHLGLASASTREISAAKDDEEVFKIFVTSTAIRYCVTLPIVLGLFVFSDYLAANVYKHAQLAFPLKIYALSLIFQGIQSILNSVISGTKRFKRLFIYQVAIAAVSAVFYIPLVYFYKINGYFYAFLGFTALSSGVLAYLALYPIRKSIKLPSQAEFKKLFKEIFSISMAIYLVKILSTNWEKLGPNLLGLFSTPSIVAVFSFAMLYAKKILSISDSVTDVNLPVLSEKYSKDQNEFKQLFSKNFDKVFVFIIISATMASFWAPEIINFLVGGRKYDAALPLIPPMLFGFILYSFLDITKSSVLIPAKMTREMVLSFIFILLGSLGTFFLWNRTGTPVQAMSWAMLVGSAISFIFSLMVVSRKLKFVFFKLPHLFLFSFAFISSWFCLMDFSYTKVMSFLVLLVLMILSIFTSNLVTYTEFKEIFGKFGKKYL
jgi:O-antigen/teichoic acid export membrane protein